METIIKNIHLISSLSDLELQKLAHGALQHQKFSRITFEILSVDGAVIKVQTTQGKTPQENFADEKTLIERTKELFNKFLPDTKVIVNAVPYKENVTAQVTPEYIRHKMTEYKVKVKDIVADTGIDKTNISAWINGTREMSQPVKAMVYYYFLVKSMEREDIEAEPDPKKWTKLIFAPNQFKRVFILTTDQKVHKVFLSKGLSPSIVVKNLDGSAWDGDRQTILGFQEY